MKWKYRKYTNKYMKYLTILQTQNRGLVSLRERLHWGRWFRIQRGYIKTRPRIPVGKEYICDFGKERSR